MSSAAVADDPGAQQWAGRVVQLRRLQRRMFYWCVPLSLIAMLIVWLVHDIEPRTFHVEPSVEAGAVRAVLRE